MRSESTFRDREIALKEREQTRLDDELAFKKKEARRTRWSNPLIIAILGAIAAALGNAAVGWQSAKDQRELENSRAITAQKAQEFNSGAQLALEAFKAESGRLLEVVKTNDPDKAAVNLQFLLDVGLISTPEIKTGLLTYLKNRKPGEGFTLPTAVTSAFSREDLTPLFQLRRDRSGLVSGTSPLDEIAYMVGFLRGRISRYGETIGQALSGYATSPSYIPKVVALMQGHGEPGATIDSKIDLNDRVFLKSLLWSLARLESGKDVSEGDLDSGIDQALKR